jgi:hypothetical protein
LFRIIRNPKVTTAENFAFYFPVVARSACCSARSVWRTQAMPGTLAYRSLPVRLPVLRLSAAAAATLAKADKMITDNRVLFRLGTPRSIISTSRPWW